MVKPKRGAPRRAPHPCPSLPRLTRGAGGRSLPRLTRGAHWTGQTLILPTYTHSSTSPATHAGQLGDALARLGEAREALALCVPNGRDYATPDALREALADHAARLAALESVEREIKALARHARAAAHRREGGGTP